jgi:ABC-type glycerol-3-phosphate transport system substrate-binding protein
LQALRDGASAFMSSGKKIASVEVVQAGSSGSRSDAIIRAFSTGQELGIFELEDSFREDWATAGYLEPLDDLIDEIGADAFVPGSLFRSADGHYYGIPSQGNPVALWVREDLLKAEGLSMFEDADSYLEASRRLTKGSQYGTAISIGANRSGSQVLISAVNQFGGDYFDRQGNLTFLEPQVLKAIKFETELLKTSPAGTSNWNFRDVYNSYMTGQIGSAYMAIGFLTGMIADAPEIAKNTRVIPPNYGGPLNGQTNWGRWTQYAISANTRNKKQTKDFLKFMVTGEQARNWVAILPGKVSPVVAVSKELEADPPKLISQYPNLFESASTNASQAITPDSNMGSVHAKSLDKSDVIMPWATELWQGTPVDSNMLQQIVVKKADPEDAWQEAGKSMQAIADKWKSAHPDWKPAK